MSGIQPIGNLHIGNDLGALGNWVTWLLTCMTPLGDRNRRMQCNAKRTQPPAMKSAPRDEMLTAGADKARAAAEATMVLVRERVGLRQPRN